MEPASYRRNAHWDYTCLRPSVEEVWQLPEGMGVGLLVRYWRRETFDGGMFSASEEKLAEGALSAVSALQISISWLKAVADKGDGTDPLPISAEGLPSTCDLSRYSKGGDINAERKTQEKLASISVARAAFVIQSSKQVDDDMVQHELTSIGGDAFTVLVKKADCADALLSKVRGARGLQPDKEVNVVLHDGTVLGSNDALPMGS